jgi:hypothetical protein
MLGFRGAFASISLTSVPDRSRVGAPARRVWIFTRSSAFMCSTKKTINIYLYPGLKFELVVIKSQQRQVRSVRLVYQLTTNNTFLSEQTSQQYFSFRTE